MAAPASTRRPGRPRDPTVEGRVLSAARDLLTARGLGGTTVGRIAAQAGVGKSTIYLRWPDRESLVCDAVGEVVAAVRPPDTGTTRGDLVALLRLEIDRARTSEARALFRALAPELAHHPRLREVWTERVVGPWRAVVAVVLERGRRRGDLASDLDTRVFLEMLFGPVLSRATLTGEALDDDLAEASVSLILDGARGSRAG